MSTIRVYIFGYSDFAMLQVVDTRCFHKFGERSIFRERVHYSSTFASLRERGFASEPSTYLDAEAAIPALQVVAGMCENVASLHAYINLCGEDWR